LLKKEKAMPNTDIRPVCYQYAFIIWLSKFFPRIGPLLIHLQSWIMIFKTAFYIGCCGSASIIFLLSRFRLALRRASAGCRSRIYGYGSGNNFHPLLSGKTRGCSIRN